MGSYQKIININADSIKKIWVIGIILLIIFIVGFYFLFFNYQFLKNYEFFQNLSKDPANLGVFGDYVGGILNPVIAVFMFYFVVEGYKLQKTELEATRRLLEVSTTAQENQIKLGALTALFNSNLTSINILQSEKSTLLSEFIDSPSDKKVVLRIKFLRSQLSLNCSPDDADFDKLSAEHELLRDEYEYLVDSIRSDKFSIFVRVNEVEDEINTLMKDNNKLKKKIEIFLK